MDSNWHEDQSVNGGTAVAESPFLAHSGADFSRGGEPTTSAQRPFLAEYQLDGEAIDHRSHAALALRDQLHDPELDEVLEDLLDEAEAQLERLATDESPTGDARAARHLARWAEALAAEADQVLDEMAEGLGRLDITEVTAGELDSALAPYESRETAAGPVTEEFLGKLMKKAAGAVRGAAALAKQGVGAIGKLALGPLLNRLKRLVRPLLKRVVGQALGDSRLVPALRPYAAMLAKRFGEEGEVPATADPRLLQLLFDSELTELLLAPGEYEQDELLGEAAAAAAEEFSGLAELDDARSRFVERLGLLEAGQDPTPLVEEFIPALMPVLRVVVRGVGRPKVASYLAKFVGRLIGPMVGPQMTPALSRAIVNAGLSLLTLEEPGEDGPSTAPWAAAEAFANVVEDTVRAVSRLTAEELDDEAMVEAAAYEEFQEAVAAAFPAAVLDPASEYLETSEPAGSWVSMPRGRRTRYRRYTRIYPVTITDQIAKAVRTFGGRSLYDVLRSHFGRDRSVQARVHLVEAVPGTRLRRVLRSEAKTGQVGRTGRGGHSLAHPLTSEAAGLLLNEPRLGREVDSSALDRAEPLAVGQRLYLLELPPAPSGQPSAVHIAIALRAREIRLAIYVNESDAQAIATRLRRKEPVGVCLAALRRIYQPAITHVLAHPRSRVRVISEDVFAESLTGSDLPRVVRSRHQPLANAVSRWVTQAISGVIGQRAEEFTAAASAPADGVTLVVTLAQPPGFDSIAALLNGTGVADTEALLHGRPRNAVEIKPGHHRA